MRRAMLTYSFDGAINTHEISPSNQSTQIDEYHHAHSAHKNTDHVTAIAPATVAATGTNAPWLFISLISKVPWLTGVPRRLGNVILRVPFMELCIRYALMCVTRLGKRAEGLLCDMQEAHDKRDRRGVGE